MIAPESAAGHEKQRSSGRAGHAIVQEWPTGTATRSAQWRCRALHGYHDEVSVYRLRGRPPLAQSAWSSPSPLPPNDHADWATLGRWDAKASQRPRRPGLKEPRGHICIRIRSRSHSRKPWPRSWPYRWPRPNLFQRTAIDVGFGGAAELLAAAIGGPDGVGENGPEPAPLELVVGCSGGSAG